MEFKVSLKQNDPLDLESIAFLKLRFFPSRLWSALCPGLEWGGKIPFSTHMTWVLLLCPFHDVDTEAQKDKANCQRLYS